MFTRYLQTVHDLTLTALIYFISSQLKVSVFIQTVLDHSDNYPKSQTEQFAKLSPNFKRT